MPLPVRMLLIVASSACLLNGVVSTAAALTPVSGVFYAGQNSKSGTNGADRATGAKRRYIAENPGRGDDRGRYDGLWTAAEHCSPANSHQFKTSIGGRKITQLAGFSLGRLGPLYFLKDAPSRASEINYILLLDPGNYADLTEGNACDDNKNINAPALLKKWLGARSTNQLVVMAGERTASGSHAALNFYLRGLPGKEHSSQVLVCDATSGGRGLAHQQVMSTYSGLVGLSAPVRCPGGSTRWPKEVQPPTSGQPPAAAPPPPSGGDPPVDSGGSAPDVPADSYPQTVGGVTHTWTDYTSAGGTQGQSIQTGQTVGVACKVEGFRVADGDTWWYKIASAPWSGAYYASADAFYNNGQTSGSLHGTPFVDTSVPDCAGSSPSPPPPPLPTYAETTGGVTHTWTNYSNAGGYQGPSIASNQTVQIACKLQGFQVADGNTWWYRVASNPWNSAYYASADAFYNNGQTSGSLHGTPFVDNNVFDC